MNTKIKWICRTAILIALLVVLQTATKPLGQIVTGSSVNAVLAVSVLCAGLWTGLTVALLSPFFAFMLGIGPQLFLISPAIAAGNCVLVLVLHFVCGRVNGTKGYVSAAVFASVCKFITLYILVVKILCSVLNLADKQIAMFSTMFSWPQLITALIGCFIAIIIAPRLKKAIK